MISQALRSLGASSFDGEELQKAGTMRLAWFLPASQNSKLDAWLTFFFTFSRFTHS
jgi:hypothetical protein